ncbi:MAG: hypothetical protein WAU48_11480 [Gammaproteobacteria bacterium]
MIRSLALSTILAIGLPLAAVGADAGDAATTSRLATSKHTLVEAIRQVEKTNGSAISAKFEYEDGKLWLSVYAAKSGRTADAEHNTLIELKGEPIAAVWKPETEVFADKEHLTRSAMQLTLMQQTKASLADLVTSASAKEKGTVYSAIPAVKNGKAVLVLLIATPDGKTHSTDVDLH